MIKDLESILYKAEDRYLDTQDLAIFKSQTFSLEKRLQTYELLRSQETEVFQYVANQLSRNFSDIKEDKICKALHHWLMVTRYCAMAMLADNPEYLQYRILEWLPEQIDVYNLKVLEENVFLFLHKRLKKNLNAEQFSLIEPFLQQAKDALLQSD